MECGVQRLLVRKNREAHRDSETDLSNSLIFVNRTLSCGGFRFVFLLLQVTSVRAGLS